MNKTPSAGDLLGLIEDVEERLRKEIETGTPTLTGLYQGRRHGNIILSTGIREPYAIIGDIHGDTDTLRSILHKVEHARLIIFLGDYVDRGKPEGQVRALYEVLSLYLDGIALPLRGNHEPPSELIPYPHDFPDALTHLYGRQKAAEIYSRALKLFSLLPHALVVNGLFIAVHGGPPTRGFDKPLIEYLGGGVPNPPLEVLEEILWNDPVEANTYRLPSPRGAGFLWGKPTTLRAVEKAGVKMIVRGHEATYRGYKWNHDGLVLTLFSVRSAPYYAEAAGFLYSDGCEPGPGREECIRLVR